MTDMRAKMKADAKRAKLVAKETIAILQDYSKMAWKALKNPLMSLGAAAILSSCGIVGNRVSNADIELNKDNSEQVIKTKQQKDSSKDDPYTYGYSDPNEVVETPEEKEAREIEEEFESIRAGEYTHGDAGTDKADYGKPGKGAPRFTEKDADEIYEQQREIRGRGIDDVELHEIDKMTGRDTDDSDNSNYRDISLYDVVKAARFGR